MTRSYDRLVKKAQRDKTLAQLLDSSPAALLGVTPADAAALRQAFGISSVRELARHPAFARAAVLLAADPSAPAPPFDPGPPPPWAAFLATAPLTHYTQHPQQRFRTPFGPVYYRGRLDGTARLILMGQDPAADEILGHRILLGYSGQRVQGFLRKLGLTRSYSMLNTFLFSVTDQFDSELERISLEAPILSFRNTWLDRLVKENPVQAIAAIGRGAQHALAHWPNAAAIPIVPLMHPAARDDAALAASWNAALATLHPLLEPDEGAAQGGSGANADPAPYGAAITEADHAPIPRADLPFGLPPWHGDGIHGARDGEKTLLWSAQV